MVHVLFFFSPLNLLKRKSSLWCPSFTSGEEKTKAKSEPKSSLKGLESTLDNHNFWKLPKTRNKIIVAQKKDQALSKWLLPTS